jgi:CubicO group peptidase (beta-lactamase class C family)
VTATTLPDLTTLVPPADDRPVSPDKVERLLARARREVDQGLAPAVQIAVARHGRLVVDATFGAPDTSRFVVFSATKALVAAALWRLIDQGLVRVEEPCATYVPEFGTNGKEVVTVEHVLTHTGGFPFAPLGPPRWSTREGRLEAFSRWSLTLEPGTTFLYHPTSGHWILAEIITAVTGLDHADAIEQLVTAPLGLGRLLGIPLDQQQGIIDAVPTGERPTPAEMEEAVGMAVDLDQLIPPDVAVNALVTLNDPDARALGVPGGGGVMRAADLALLYQGFLHDPGGLWSPEILEAGTKRPRVTLPDWSGVPANRTLGLILASDDGFADRRSFGRTASPQAFGHPGAGGQLAFADPVTGLSVGYATAGLDQHLIREGRRTIALASLAADLLED